MRTILTVLISILVLSVGFFVIFQKFLMAESKMPVVSPSNSEVVIPVNPSPSPQIEVKSPVKVQIPKIDVNAPIQQVGLDMENKMDVPKLAANIAWYKLGKKPGEVGNAVLAGHFDDKDGSPAVFYNLSKLEKGDEINVVDEAGNKFTYLVTDKVSYKLEEFPLQEVFGENSKSRLNLITCEGVYNKSSQLYSHRLVIYSELK